MFRMEPGRNREDPTPKVEVKEKGTRKKKGMRERDIERESGKGQASSLSPSLSLSPSRSEGETYHRPPAGNILRELLVDERDASVAVSV